MANEGPDAGQIGLTDTGNEFNIYSFMVRQMLGRIRGLMLVKVVKVHPGQNGQAGTLDVTPITNQVDGEGKSTPHGTVYGIPYLRHQNGPHAVIMDPVVGDMGPMHVYDRDISGNIGARGAANPGSNRRFDPADGMYLGGILNAAATTFMQQAGNSITHQAKAVNHTGGNITHSAIKQDSTGGNITHSADQAMAHSSGTDMTHTAGGNIHQTASNGTHTIDAQNHNVNAITNVSKLLKTASIARLVNYIH